VTVQAKEYAGASAATTLSGSISNVSATIACVDASTFPTGSTAPFVVAIDRGTASEEKVLITSRTGNSLTVTTRGYDGTTAASHASGATIEHVLDAVSFTDANKAAVQTIAKVTTAGDILVGTGAEAMKRLGIGAAYKAIGANAAANDLAYLDTMASLLTAKGDLPGASAANTPVRTAVGTDGQVLTADAASTAGFKWSSRTAVFETSHTWTIGGAIAVPSGDTNFINPMFVAALSGDTVTLDSVRYKINSGTSVTFKMQVNGSDATGFTGISCTTTAASTNPTDVALSNNDVLVPVVTAVSGSPVNMTITAYLHHSVVLT
jgi:hypothetical protein